jgi:histidinol-phosphate aminotransferase
MLEPRSAVRTLPSYHPPLSGRDGLRLDFNENTAGCSPRVLERLRQLEPEDLARYPEREPAERVVAEFLGVAPPEVLLTNGVDEAIHILCQTYLEPGDEALIIVPTYSMYRIYIMAAGAKLVSVPAAENFQFPAKELLQRITPRTRLIAIANPNNPTGTVAPPQDLLQIARSAPHAAVLIDEAYFEFYGQSLLPHIREFANLFIARTFSKAYGLAGIRLGLLAGNAEAIRAVRRVSSPYNVNAVALACVPAALADQNYIQRYVGEICGSRTRLEQFLADRDVPYWPSHANFVLIRISSAQSAAEFVARMHRQGILIRDRSADPGCAGCVRITLGPGAHSDRLLATLDAALGDSSVAEVRPTREEGAHS